MAEKTLKLNGSQFSSFYKNNPDFDIMNFDFHDKSAINGVNLDKDEKQLEELKAYQRLLRISPDREVAGALIKKGLNSACKIASMPEHKFVRENSEIFDDDIKSASKFHKKAVHIKLSAIQQFGIVKDLVASPHYRASTISNTHESVIEYYEGIPSYEYLFGDLDYFESPHCETIFGPAAYFQDIMQITDDYITDPNMNPVRRIPAGYKLEERRPDLFDMKLTCKNTNEIVPYIKVVNRVLQSNIQSIGDIDNAFEKVALSKYPFNLPFNLPLNKIRVVLSKLGVKLSDIFADFENSSDVEELDAAREKLGLSVTQLSMYSEPAPDAESLSKYYGYTINIKDPGVIGLGTVGFMSGQSKVTGAYTEFLEEVNPGDSILVNGEKIKIKDVVSDTELTTEKELESTVGFKYYSVFNTGSSFEGPGTIRYDPSDGKVVGKETEFTKDFRVGDEIDAAQMTKKVTKVISDTELEVDTPWPGVIVDAHYTVIKAEIPEKGAGTIRYDPADGIVQGNGTHFTTDFAVGDKIKAANMAKTVTRIMSDTQLEVDTPWPGVIPDVTYFIIKDVHERVVEGKGIAIFPEKVKRIFGQGSEFTKEFKAGYLVQVNGKRNKVQEIVSDTEMILKSAWEVNSGSSYTIQPQSKVTNIEDCLPVKGIGTVSANKAETKVTGTDTKFKTQLKVGIEIEIDGQIRTVDNIVSDTELNVKSKFTESKSSSPFVIFPENALDVVDNFIHRTDMTREKLNELLRQKLTEKEIESAVSKSFFINNTDKETPPMAIYLSDNPDNHVQRIAELNLSRLDRINRFVRLANVIQWGFADLNYAMDAINANEITGDLIINLAKIESIKNSSKLNMEEAGALFSDMKNWGIYIDSDFPSFFDSVFNNPNLLDGKDPYEKTSTVPFDPFRNPVQTWTIDDQNGDNGTIRNRMRAALMLNDSDLTKLARYVLCIVGKKGEPTVELNLENLSWFYRIQFLSDQIGLTLDEYLVLLHLIFYPDGDSYLEPPANAFQKTIDEILRILEISYWLDESTFDVYELLYICDGKCTDSYSEPYTQADIKVFVNGMAESSDEIKLIPDMLAINDLDKDQATQIFNRLVENNKVNKAGVFSNDKIVYDDISVLLPVIPNENGWDCGFNKNTFHKLIENITPDDSLKVFNALKSSSPPVLESLSVETTASLVENFSEKTNLDFLADILGIEKDDILIQQIRQILLQTKNNIADLIKKLNATQDMQINNLTKELANFLGTEKGIVTSLIPIACRQSKLTNYLFAFYTVIPDTGKVPDNLSNFIKTVSQWQLAAEGIKLNAGELSYITGKSGPEHFSINNIDKLTVENVKSLSDYKHFEITYNDEENNILLDYFSEPESSPENKKLKLLSKVTGWDTQQISTLIDYFWDKTKSATDDYDTVAGILRMKACFDMGDKLETDLEFIMKLCNLSHMKISTDGETIIEKNWNFYESMVTACKSLISGKFGNEKSSELNNEINKVTDTSSRNALLAYALWLFNFKNPSITSPDALYQYLLIDVEMSACADTSLISQGIASVQLYMQRCRMMLEPGILEINVPKIWWTWISQYRTWEVNRKIFLYPENYIDPSLRKDVSGIFKNLSSDILQNDITKANVEKSFFTYFQELAVLANLVYVSSYSCIRKDSDTGQEMETIYLIGRTNTQPYTYYFRTLDDGESWSYWQEIKLSIPAKTVSPVYAFDRLFIFWAEIDTGKSSTMKEQTLNSETVHKATIKYSFLYHNAWVTPQILEKDIIINAYPITYAEINSSGVVDLIDEKNQFWHAPYAVSTGKGLVGSGTIKFSKNSQIVTGTHTLFEREIKAGDKIQCMGEIHVVESITGADKLVVTTPWLHDSDSAKYKIRPLSDSGRFEPFIGEGKVVITEGMMTVSGIGTKFLDEFTVGDKIKCDNETHLVASIIDDTNLLTASAWVADHSKSAFSIIPQRSGAEQILVMFGAAAEVPSIKDYKEPTIQDNPEKDSFKEQRNTFNSSVYDAAIIAKNSYLKKSNFVTLTSGFLIDKNLAKTESYLLITDYKSCNPGNPQPFRADLNREQSSLLIENSQNLIEDNYWGNNLAGLENPKTAVTDGEPLNLLNYVSEKKSSLINVANQPGWFVFNNSDEAFLVKPEKRKTYKYSDILYIQPAPFPDMLNNVSIGTGAFTDEVISLMDSKFNFTRLTTNTISSLTQRLFAGGIDNLLTIDSQTLPELPFNRFYADSSDNPPPYVIPPSETTMDFNGSFGDYFWEIFFHTPFLIAKKLNENKHFEEAKSWFQYIFNPTQTVHDDYEKHPDDRFWRFLPFRSMKKESIAEILADKRQIREYNYDPFDPHIIAKYRHVAYAKTIVMQYIDNLLDWGDFLYSQNTRETINQAANIYLLAKDLLGERPESLGKAPDLKPKSFNELKSGDESRVKKKLENFLVDLENSSESFWDSDTVQYLNIPLIGINTYFYIPENKDFIKYWDRVEDRLFKIRHCMNIDGVVQQLPLFSPPISPMALIRAVAGGGSALSFAAQISRQIPFYKYDYLLEKTKSFASQLSSLGSALLSALEKKDAEKMNLIRMQQEKTILNLTTSIKEKEIEDAETAEKALAESLASANYRKNHYAKLQSEGISDKENLSMAAMTAAMLFNVLGSITKTAASIGYAVPQAGSPFAMTYGGEQIGSALNAASGVFEIGATVSNFASQLSLTMAGYDRRASDWAFQEKLADFDAKQIQEQINSNKIKQAIAEYALRIHMESIKQNEENELFLKDKFTNEELYQWLVNRLSTIYFQTYTLAHDMAMATQAAFQYEFNTDKSFIDFGYWDSLHKGLGAAEGLLLSLNQMEKFSIDNDLRYLEIEKNISLLQINPNALVQFREKGECIFELSEKLFDYDFPGHYARKIKSISITIPAIVGPYQSVNATLTQLSNKTVLVADDEAVNAVNFLIGGKGAKTPPADVLRSNIWVNQQIAISKADNDSGVFELNFKDSRYLPFEGTGAVSSWRLSMPKSTNSIDFNSISDVIISLKYTAYDGGSAFRKKVENLKALSTFNAGNFITLRQFYPTAWNKLFIAPTGGNSPSMSFKLPDFVPRNIADAKINGFHLKIESTSSVPGSYMTFQIAKNLSPEINLSADNDFVYSFSRPIEIEKIVGDIQKISFDLSKVPASLKTEDGKSLNRDALEDIQIIFYYQGTVNF